MNNYNDKKIIFGTDGWRGLINEEFNFDSVQAAAQAFADYLKLKFPSKKIKAAVGFDGRNLSRESAILFSKVLSGNNIFVFLSEKIEPTPLISFFVKNKALEAGVMITASHNPPDYNGIKFKANYGGPFLTEETYQVEKLLGKNPISKNEFNIDQTDFRNSYYNHIEQQIDFSIIKKSELNILVDSMSGAGQTILENILKKHGCNVKTIYKFAEPHFSDRLPEPINKNLSPLKNELIKNKYSIGLATDGDADRVSVMLENGEWLSTQETILLLCDYIINKKNISGDIIKTSSVTDKIRIFENENRKVFDVQVGFKFVCEQMLKNNIAFGCEESGGFGFKNHIPERDGIFFSLLLIEMLASSNYKTISEYVFQKRKQFGNIFYDRIDFHYSKANLFEKLPKLFLYTPDKIADFKVKKVVDFNSSREIINGIKFFLEGNPRWLLIRASETEPMFRIYAEGESDEEVKLILQSGINLLNKNF